MPACASPDAGLTSPVGRRHGVGLMDVLIAIAALLCVAAIGAPYLASLIEKSRQETCSRRLKNLSLAAIEFHDEHNRFPSGQVNTRFKTNEVGRYADPDEPRSTEEKANGRSWIVDVLPWLNQKDLYDRWNLEKSVVSNADVAQTEISSLYCPSRRGGMSAGGWTKPCERVVESWRRGGNDYSGCSGSGISFNDEARQTYALTNDEIVKTLNRGRSAFSSAPSNRGIFGVNSRVTRKELADHDGIAYVLLAAERALMTGSTNELRSSDGWAWGGPATLFSTRLTPASGRHYSEAGSAHPGLLHVATADARVRAVNWTSLDLKSWESLGDWAQGSPIAHPDFRR